MENLKNIFIQEMEKETNKTTTQNGAATFASTLDANLDLFSKSLRYLDEFDLINTFRKALLEDKTTALRNLLYLLDIREGKGERKISKLLIKETLISDLVTADEKITLLANIGNFGRLDYLVDLIVDKDIKDIELTSLTTPDYIDRFGFTTNVTNVVIKLIKSEIALDNLLIYKWMPSTRGARKIVAKTLFPLLGFANEREYRKMLTEGRARLNLIETLLTEKRYDEIDFSKVPTKAMLKYSKAFGEKTSEAFKEFITKVNNGEEKINANNLHINDIIAKFGSLPIGRRLRIPENVELLNTMWNEQTNFVPENTSAVVVADTSMSMSGVPMSVSVGLALYFAERNKGAWEDVFITFSSEANLVKLPKGKLQDKLQAIDCINANTNIDSVFELILKTALTSDEAKQSMPEHIIIVSDMEFDRANESEDTNYEGWKVKFERNGLSLPKIIFWNASQYGNQSSPVVKTTENVSMVSGFSPSVFENLFNLDEFSPMNMMFKTLERYSEFF